MPPRLRRLAFQLDPSAAVPLGVQIVRGVTRAIEAGHLAPGTQLPSSRQLGEQWDVNRNTVLAALRELEAEGWVVSRQGSGTYVADTLPSPKPAAAPVPVPGSPLGFDLPDHLRALTAPVAQLLDLADGLPDVRLAPVETLAKAYQRALRLHGETLLQYGEPQGNQLLLRGVAEMLRVHRGVFAEEARILITRGSRMALDLVAMALLRPGDRVAVEDPGNRAAWETLRQASGAELVPVPVDGEGMDVEALEAVLARGGVRMVHVAPGCQFPTGRAMSAARRARLLELARQHRVAVLEDDPDHDYHYEGAVAPPLVAQDAHGQVLYIGSLSRLLAPGVRLGFLVVPGGLADRLAAVRKRMDWQGDRVLEWAVADLWRDGDLSRHLRKVRRVYQARRDRMAALLQEGFRERLDLRVPPAGLGLWVEGRGDWDFPAWVERCRARGVHVHGGHRYDFAGRPLAATRLGFAHVDEAQIAAALETMRAVLP